MSARSIAGRAANMKQRQKIAHASNYWKRLQEAKKGEEGQLPSCPKINTKKTTCQACGTEHWYNFTRCPSCNKLQ